MRKLFLIVVLTALALPAYAADPAPKPVEKQAGPTCGKTAEDCQKVVDELNKQLQTATMAYTAARNQRDTYRQQADDSAISTAIQQAQAQSVKMPEPKK